MSVYDIIVQIEWNILLPNNTQKNPLCILPNVIFAVNPLPTPLLSVVNIINIWFPKDVTGDGTEFPVTKINNLSLSLPPSYIFKFAFPS